MPTDEILTLEIEPPYIGSAVSPTVDIAETTDDITVTITDFRGEHSYTVEKTDQAIADAEQAAQNANDTAQTVAQGWTNKLAEINGTLAQQREQMGSAARAESQRVTAENLRVNAENERVQEWDELSTDATAATSAANEAAGQANTATQGAIGAANAANDATTRANNTITGITQTANQIFAQAGQATIDANAAAQSANTAATNANTKAGLADTAAQNADTATTAANNAAQTATTAAEQADAAREAIQDDLAAKADKDGYYQQLTAGLADTLMSGDSETVQFAQRTSGRDGMASIQSIHGNTVAENGELVSVNIEGVKAIGFNQWDEEWEVGILNNDGTVSPTMTDRIVSSTYVPVISGETYCIYLAASGVQGRMAFYNKNYSLIQYNADWTTNWSNRKGTFTVPSGAVYMKFCTANGYGNVYGNNICINISDPDRNGEYEPYHESVREIPASTYFPDGLRSAGTAYDELDFVNHKAITRVGETTFNGSEQWGVQTQGGSVFYTELDALVHKSNYENSITCDKLDVGRNQGITLQNMQVTGYQDANSQYPTRNWVYIKNTNYTDAQSFKNWLSSNPVTITYELATTTETDLPEQLQATYPVEMGGTEFIIIPTGEQSTPPTMVIVYAYNADGIRDVTQSIVAPVERGVASSNYAVGAYLVMGGILYRVTTAIATGETINPGTNCTATTVMAELIRLTA